MKVAEPAILTPAMRSAGVMSRRAAHWLHTVTVPSASTEASRSGSGAACGSAKSSGRPGSATPAAPPVSHSETGTPLATAVAATVNAWLHRSGSSLPAVTLITRFLATRETLVRAARRPAQTGHRRLRSRAMHGMLSATIMIIAYAVVAIAVGYAAVKVIRGGPHDG